MLILIMVGSYLHLILMIMNRIMYAMNISIVAIVHPLISLLIVLYSFSFSFIALCFKFAAKVVNVFGCGRENRRFFVGGSSLVYICVLATAVSLGWCIGLPKIYVYLKAIILAS